MHRVPDCTLDIASHLLDMPVQNIWSYEDNLLLASSSALGALLLFVTSREAIRTSSFGTIIIISVRQIDSWGFIHRCMYAATEDTHEEPVIGRAKQIIPTRHTRNTSTQRPYRTWDTSHPRSNHYSCTPFSELPPCMVCSTHCAMTCFARCGTSVQANRVSPAIINQLAWPADDPINWPQQCQPISIKS